MATSDLDRWLRDRADSYRSDARALRKLGGENLTAMATAYDIAADELHKLRAEIKDAA